jgi:hypothetical protein
MDWFIDFTNNLSPAFWAILGVVVGGLVSFVGNWSIKNLEYRNAFYQKLIDKRMILYDELEEALKPFNKFDIDPENRIICMHVVRNPDEFQRAFRDFQLIKAKSQWFGQSTRGEIFKLADFLWRLDCEIKPGMSKSELTQISLDYSQKAFDLTTSALESMYGDYLELHDIRPLKKRSARRFFETGTKAMSKAQRPAKGKMR